MVGFYYRPSDQAKPDDEAFVLHLQVLCSQALMLLGDLNYSDIYWKSSMLSCRLSRRLLEYVQDNFPSQIIDSSTWGDDMLELLIINASELTGDIRIGGCMGCSDHEVVEFTLLRDICQAKSKLRC